MQSQSLRQNDLLRLQQELEAIRHENNHFVYTVSHDFAAPLRAISGFSRLLQKEYEKSLDAKGRHYLEFIVSGGDKAQEMLRGLLQYSRLNTRNQPYENINALLLIDKCLSALRCKIEKCDGVIHIQGTLPSINVDVDQFYQLFIALLDNALTYCRSNEGPQVVISAEDHDTCWKFLIKDNGIGIEPKNSTRIFELFRRLHTDEEYRGIGIGLTLSKRIVEYHGGAIGVMPSPDGGSIFWFSIPK